MESNTLTMPESKGYREEYFQEKSPLYFDVFERNIQFSGAYHSYPIKSHKAIVRFTEDHGPRCIGVVGSNYKVLPMKDICRQLEDAFVESMTHEQLQGVRVIDQEAYFGGKLIRQYIFPHIKAGLHHSTSDIAFRVIIVNGYDGSSSLSLYSGAIDFFCSNGMVSGVFDLIVKRHTKGLTIEKLADRVKQSIDIFYSNAKTWERWMSKEITSKDLDSVMEALPISDKLKEELALQYWHETSRHGRTVWALYSAMTYYATHADGKFAPRNTGNDSTYFILHNREKEVSRWVNTEEFRRIAV